jgi:hypothetical protein
MRHHSLKEALHHGAVAKDVIAGKEPPHDWVIPE